MASRLRRWARNLLIVLLLLPVILIVAIRLLRHQASAPQPASAGIVRVRNLFTDLYGLRVGDRVVVFDGGIDGEGKALDTLVAGVGGSGRDAVTDVLLTHGHFDHVAESPLCRKARIRVGRGDVEMLAGRAQTEPRFARMLVITAPSGPIEASAPLEGPTTIPLGEGKEILAVPFPGHTPGSYVYFYEGTLIAGDSIQIDGDRLDFAMSLSSVDMDANRRSVARLRGALGGRAVDTVCTGHFACTLPGRGAAMLDALIARAGEP